MPLPVIRHRPSIRRLPYGIFRARTRSQVRTGMHRQRGAAAVLAAVWIGVAIAAMGVLDVGYVYMMRRQTQQIADMAAVAGAQTIGMSGGCATATASAQQAASANGFAGSTPVGVACGRWTTAGGFDTSGAVPLNAVQVTATQQVRHFFIGPASSVQAVATAKATSTAAFSLTSSLASLSGGAINSLLSGLLGANVSLDVGTYQALASTTIKIGDLATQLGAASVNDLLNSSTTVSNLASAMISVLNRNNVVNASVSAGLSAIQAAAAGGAKLALGNSAGTPGMLAIGLADTQAAASASISALDALLVAAEIAHGTSALDLGVALNPSSIPGVTLPLSLTAKAAVLQPPVIAVGEAGTDGSGNYITSAHSAQVRVYIDLNLSVPSILGVLPAVSVDLPLYLEAAQGTAGLSALQCAPSRAASTNSVVVQTGIVNACISGNAASNMTNLTTASSCATPAPLVTLTVPVLLTTATVNAGTYSPQSGLIASLQKASAPALTFNGVAGDGDDFQSVNTNGLGSATSGLLTQLASQLPSTLYVTVGGLVADTSVLIVLKPLLDLLVSTLTPILNSLDGLIVPVLQLLGVQVGVSTVHSIGMSCSDAQLVN